MLKAVFVNIYFLPNIINRDNLRCNYLCSLVLRQTLADCDAVVSSRCRCIKTEICAKNANTNYWARAGICEKRLLPLPTISICP